MSVLTGLGIPHEVLAMLPDWFKITTPLETYNPDWAVVVERDGQRRLFFVVETKAPLFTHLLRPREEAKIQCGREHFAALGTPVDFLVADPRSSLQTRWRARFRH